MNAHSPRNSGRAVASTPIFPRPTLAFNSMLFMFAAMASVFAGIYPIGLCLFNWAIPALGDRPAIVGAVIALIVWGKLVLWFFDRLERRFGRWLIKLD